ncbi:hypothetical protein BH09BAC1_BH09BAC1_16720 [soil metagenome]
MKQVPVLLILIFTLFVSQLALSQTASRGQAMEILIAGDNSLQMLDVEQAIEYYTAAISLDPGFADAYMKRANAYAIAGRATEAKADYNMAVNINPYIDYLYDSRAKIKILVADFKGAMVDVDNMGGPIDITQGYLLEMMRNTFPMAITQLDSLIASDPTKSQNFAVRALARIQADDANGALADVTQALELNPTNAFAHNLQGLLQLGDGNYTAASASFEAAIKIDENYAEAYLNRGRVQNLLGNPNSALVDMNYAIALDTNFALAYLSRAMVYKSMGNVGAAISDYDKVIARYPDFADAYFSRGFARKMQGDFGGAIRDYDRSILLNPNDPSTYNNRGILRVLADDYAGAAKDFRTAISLQPEYAAAYHNLGMSLIMNHSRTEGCQYLQTSINQGFLKATNEYKYFCTQ